MRRMFPLKEIEDLEYVVGTDDMWKVLKNVLIWFI